MTTESITQDTPDTVDGFFDVEPQVSEASDSDDPTVESAVDTTAVQQPSEQPEAPQEEEAPLPNVLNEFSLEQNAQISIAQELRDNTLGCKLSISRMGFSRALPKEQVSQAATLFGAEGKMMSASKKLISANNAKLKRVSAILAQAKTLWIMSTVDFPVDGIRLISRKQIEKFSKSMDELKVFLDAALADLQANWSEIKAQAKIDLGDLYNETDYPEEVKQFFRISYEFPEVEPPQHLRQLHPELYEREKKRIAARFDEALQGATEQMTDALSGMVEHLIDKLTPGSDGKQKIISTSAVENMAEFFTRFEALNIKSDAALTAAVEQAKQLISGVDVKELRKDDSQRVNLREKMQALSDTLGTMISSRPSRMIMDE